MPQNETIKLPSGAKLEITPAEFKVAKSAYMTVASEIKGTKISLQEQLDVNFFKDLFCMAISSPAIEAALWWVI